MLFSIIFTAFHEKKGRVNFYMGKIMTLKEKLKISHIKRYWKKHGRKNLFTWIHRYLRLHSELLVDSIYKNIYDYICNTLVAYLKKDVKNRKLDDIQLGEVIDALADVFNKVEAERVNKYKAVVDDLYEFWKENPCAIDKIHI